MSSAPLAPPAASGVLPAAPAVGRRTLLLFALANAGGVIAYMPLLSLLLPIKVEGIAGDARLGLFTATVIAGAMAASLSNILFGWLTDRSVARGRSRRPWLVGGVAAMVAAYLLVALASSPLAIVGAIVAFQVAVNALLAPLFAIMADEIPDRQKGLGGGLLALGNPVAAAIGAVLVGLPMLGEGGQLMILWLAIAAFVGPLLCLRDRPCCAPSERSRREKEVLRRDLAVAWVARLLVQVAGNAVSLYLLYFFASISAEASSATLASSVGHLLWIGYLLPLPIAVAIGRLSDRTGQRKPFLLGAAAVAALGLATMGLADSWTLAATGFGFYAAGSAVFLALHATFSMQLLPDPRNRGRDLGLLNLTNTLPALLGPLLAWLLASPEAFGTLMFVLAALMLCGGMAILMVRGRR